MTKLQGKIVTGPCGNAKVANLKTTKIFPFTNFETNLGNIMLSSLDTNIYILVLKTDVKRLESEGGKAIAIFYITK